MGSVTDETSTRETTFMDRHDFMRRAIALADANVAAGTGGPFGSVVVCEGMIVGEGMNTVTSNYDPTAHAEIVAIRAACKKLGRFSLEGCEIYASCEPCPMCLSAIYWARLDRAFYGNTAADAAGIGFDDAFLYRELTIPMAQRKLPIEQILRDEAISSFRAWRDSPVKVPY
jgi:tRNA(Arg) A34 adenosine deaminase TadA